MHHKKRAPAAQEALTAPIKAMLREDDCDKRVCSEDGDATRPLAHVQASEIVLVQDAVAYMSERQMVAEFALIALQIERVPAGLAGITAIPRLPASRRPTLWSGPPRRKALH